MQGRSLTVGSVGGLGDLKGNRGGGRTVRVVSGKCGSCDLDEWVERPSSRRLWLLLAVLAVSTVRFVAREPPTICGRTRAADCVASVGVLARAGVTRGGERLSCDDTRDKVCL